MDCTQFVMEVGLEEALEIVGEEVWDKAKLTFEQWGVLFYMRNPAPALKPKILGKMAQTASDRDQWLEVFIESPEGSPTRLLAIEKIRDILKTLPTFEAALVWRPIKIIVDIHGEWIEVKTVWLQRLTEVAETFAHWIEIYNLGLKNQLNVFGDSDLAAKALVKMRQRAKTKDDWLSVYSATPDGNPEKENALANMARLAKTHDDWWRVWFEVKDKNNFFSTTATLEMLGSASTFKQWSLICSYLEKDLVRKLCIPKLLELVETFYDWLCIYKKNSDQIDDQIKVVALSQLLAKANTFDQWLDVWRWTPKGSAANVLAQQKVRGYVKLD